MWYMCIPHLLYPFLYLSHVESNFLKMIQMNLFTKQKQTYRYQNQTNGCQTGNAGGWGKIGAWDEHMLLYIR